MSHAQAALAVIGGSGLYSLRDDGEEGEARSCLIDTPYAGEPVRLYLEQTESGPVWFLPRHGREHNIAPHEINYRANLWALRHSGARRIIAVNAVGGIGVALQPGVLALPDQLIDYTWGREQTFFSGKHGFDRHIDFTRPYDEALCAVLRQAAELSELRIISGGVYACTQGPRLETAAEVQRLARDGCDMIGMTGMPEAALARELDIPYASLALVVNRAAGLAEDEISLEAIKAVMVLGIGQVRAVLLRAIALLQP